MTKKDENQGKGRRISIVGMFLPPVIFGSLTEWSMEAREPASPRIKSCLPSRLGLDVRSAVGCLWNARPFQFPFPNFFCKKCLIFWSPWLARVDSGQVLLPTLAALTGVSVVLFGRDRIPWLACGLLRAALGPLQACIWIYWLFARAGHSAQLNKDLTSHTIRYRLKNLAKRMTTSMFEGVTWVPINIEWWIPRVPDGIRPNLNQTINEAPNPVTDEIFSFHTQEQTLIREQTCAIPEEKRESVTVIDVRIPPKAMINIFLRFPIEKRVKASTKLSSTIQNKQRKVKWQKSKQKSKKKETPIAKTKTERWKFKSEERELNHHNEQNRTFNCCHSQAHHERALPKQRNLRFGKRNSEIYEQRSVDAPIWDHQVCQLIPKICDLQLPAVEIHFIGLDLMPEHLKLGLNMFRSPVASRRSWYHSRNPFEFPLVARFYLPWPNLSIYLLDVGDNLCLFIRDVRSRFRPAKNPLRSKFVIKVSGTCVSRRLSRSKNRGGWPKLMTKPLALTTMAFREQLPEEGKILEIWTPWTPLRGTQGTALFQRNISNDCTWSLSVWSLNLNSHLCPVCCARFAARDYWTAGSRSDAEFLLQLSNAMIFTFSITAA